MANDNFYKIFQIDGRIKDPEQRICEDIFAAVFGFWSTILFGTALPICKLFFFTYRVGAIMGHKWSLGIAGILAMNMAVIKYAMPDYGKMYKDLSNQEGKFKKIHARVKLCAESIGFFGGGDREKQMVNERFDKYMVQDWVRHWCNFKFGVISDFFRSRVPETLQWVLRFYYGFNTGGTDAEMLADKGSGVFLGQQQLQQMSGEIFGAIGQCMALVERMAELSGRLGRVFEMQWVLDELEAENPATAIGNQVIAEGLDLCVKVNGDVSPGDLSKIEALMVTGRNATGKSALVRAIAGLWPMPEGTVEVPHPLGSNRPGLKEVFIVPQRIYMALGTLADQITYPIILDSKTRSKEVEAKLFALLELVGVEYLVDRWSGTERIEWGGSNSFGAVHGKTIQDLDSDGLQWHSGWDHVTRWEDVLSLSMQWGIPLTTVQTKSWASNRLMIDNPD